jgi:hypothetical protein
VSRVPNTVPANRSDAIRAPSPTRTVSDGGMTLNPRGIELPMSALYSG